MTEGMMAPERQGWFAGVKAKVKDTFKRFSVAGAKEHFYKQNAELIKKVTANMTPEQKQQAYADIEQDALASAKTDVAVHWGAAVLGTTAATFGLGMFSEPVRRFAATHGGPIGRGYENLGLRARQGLSRLVEKFDFLRFGSSSHRGMGGGLTERQQAETRHRSDRYYDAGNFGMNRVEIANPIQAMAAKLRNELDLVKRAMEKRTGTAGADVLKAKQAALEKKLASVQKLQGLNAGTGSNLQKEIVNLSDTIENNQRRLAGLKTRFSGSDSLVERKSAQTGMDRISQALSKGRAKLEHLIDRLSSGSNTTIFEPKVISPIRPGAPGYRKP